MLPLCTATTVVYTYSIEEWIKILLLRYYGVTGAPHPNAKIIANRIKYLLEEQGYDMTKIKDPKELIKKYNVISHNSYIDMDTTRTLVVRSKYGNYPVLFYDWNGPVCDCPALWAIKMDYHYQTGCNYCESRPILYSTWMELPKELQNATCIVDNSDMEDELVTA